MLPRPAPLLLLSIFFLLLPGVGCEGPTGLEGPAGPAGQDGQDGEDGQDGRNGTNATAASYVLTSACQDCHETEHQQWSNMGHSHAMVKISGAKPDDPPYKGYPAQPPTDDQGKQYGWGDITYLIGGFGWGAVFSDAQGFVISGSQTRYVTETGQWTDYEKDTPAGTVIMGCPECHATRYQDAGGHEITAKQGDLEGVGGTWLVEGITCERCHGPGSLHLAGQGYGPIQINRSSAHCGKCHSSEPLNTIMARDGLIDQAQQWNEIAATKMRIVACVDCHDPHQSAKHAPTQANPDAGIVTRCETCHYKLVSRHKVAKHTTDPGGPDCLRCHMPRAVKSAVGDAATWTGDLRSHLFRINNDITAPQLSADGKNVNPYLTIDVACRQCHVDALAKTDAELQANATGYHD
jgi:ssDNA-binding Zn-finger/Zn-ribbon topoisomerase 1